MKDETKDYLAFGMSKEGRHKQVRLMRCITNSSGSQAKTVPLFIAKGTPPPEAIRIVQTYTTLEGRYSK